MLMQHGTILMLLGNNLFEAFKEDVTAPVIPITVYADTFRRQFLDTAGKLARHAGKLIMKVPPEPPLSGCSWIGYSKLAYNL